VSQYQKGKNNLDLLEQEIVSGSGFSSAVANLHLAPNREQCQHPTTKFFTGLMSFQLPKQQRQSTEGRYSSVIKTVSINCIRALA